VWSGVFLPESIEDECIVGLGLGGCEKSDSLAFTCNRALV
jgi:hypothetical protein